MRLMTQPITTLNLFNGKGGIEPSIRNAMRTYRPEEDLRSYRNRGRAIDSLIFHQDDALRVLAEKMYTQIESLNGKTEQVEAAHTLENRVHEIALTTEGPPVALTLWLYAFCLSFMFNSA